MPGEVNQKGRVSPPCKETFVDFPQAPSESLAGAGTPNPIPGVVVGTRTNAHEGPIYEGGLLMDQMYLPDVPPRLSLCGTRAQLKGIFNPGENGCHSWLAQKLAKSAVSETKKWSQKTKRGFHEILGSSLGEWWGCARNEGRQGLSDCIETDGVLLWSVLALWPPWFFLLSGSEFSLKTPYSITERKVDLSV